MESGTFVLTRTKEVKMMKKRRRKVQNAKLSAIIGNGSILSPHQLDNIR
jgi:hypothetical protein